MSAMVRDQIADLLYRHVRLEPDVPDEERAELDLLVS